MYVIANSTGGLFWTGTKFSKDASAAKAYTSEVGAKRALSHVSTASGRPRLVVMAAADVQRRSA